MRKASLFILVAMILLSCKKEEAPKKEVTRIEKPVFKEEEAKKVEVKIESDSKAVMSKELMNLQKKALEEKMDFKAYGVEPFWDLSLDLDREFLFSFGVNKEVELKMKPTEKIVVADAPIIRYKTTNGQDQLDVVITQKASNDTMSETQFHYEVALKAKVNGKDYDLKGVGYYAKNYRINDIFVLEKVDGKELSEEEKVIFEFRLADNKIYTNDSGNVHEVFAAEFIGDKFKVFNSKSPETFVEKLMNNSNYIYDFQEGKLIMRDEKGKTLELKKID